MKKKKLLKRVLFGFCLSLTFSAIILLLLLYKPKVLEFKTIAKDSEVSPYLTHDLSPAFYNGVQKQSPFVLSITHEGINDIIRRAGWPMESEEAKIYMPEVEFTEERIMISAPAVVKRVELIVTIGLRPSIDEAGLLNIEVSTFKIGAINITVLAKAIAEKMLNDQMAGSNLDGDELGAKITAALLDGKGFDPVFEVKGKKVRAYKIETAAGQVNITFVPLAN